MILAWMLVGVVLAQVLLAWMVRQVLRVGCGRTGSGVSGLTL
jgi:hypothetical protein